MAENIDKTHFPTNGNVCRLPALLLLAVLCVPAGAQVSGSSDNAFLKQVWLQNGTQREVTGNQLAVFNTPCFDYLRVFSASADGTCSAVFKRTGELSWRFYTGEPLNNGLHLFEGGPLVVAGAASVYALNPENGLLLWKRSFDEPLSTTITKADRSIIAADTQGNLLCVAAEDGSFRWQTTLPAPARSTPLFNEGRLYVGADDGHVFCLEASDGKKVWEMTIDQPVRSGFTVAEGRLYFGADDDYVYCLNADSGALRWRSRATGNITSIPAYIGETLFIAPNDRTLRAFNGGNGHYRDKSPIKLTASLRVAPVAVNDMLIYPLGKELTVISPKTFAKLGGYTCTEEITTAVAFDSEANAFYFGCQNGNIVAVSTAAALQAVERLPQAEPRQTVTIIPGVEERETTEPETVRTEEEQQPAAEKTDIGKEEKPREQAEPAQETATEHKEEPTSVETKAEKPPEQPESEGAKEEKPAETPPPKDETARPEEAAPEAVAVEEKLPEMGAEEALPKAREATAAGNLEEASRLWKLALTGDSTMKYTVTIGLFCRREAALSLIKKLKDGEVMVFEKRIGETPCFFVCLGLYDGREAALQALAALDIERLQAQPSVYRMDSFVP